ncbi:unnamed protein product, partial [Tetraodon nigroviridis]
SVSEAAHLRVEGYGRNGLLSHEGFWMEPLGGSRDWWQKEPAGSEVRGGNKGELKTPQKQGEPQVPL